MSAHMPHRHPSLLSSAVFAMFCVSIHDTMRSLGFTKSCHFYLVNALIVYFLLYVPALVNQSFLDFSEGFHLMPNVRPCSTSIHPPHLRSIFLKCESVSVILQFTSFHGSQNLNSSANHQNCLHNLITTYDLNANSHLLISTSNYSHFQLCANL